MPPQRPGAFDGHRDFPKLRRHLTVSETDRDVLWEHQLGVFVDRLCPRKTRAYGEGLIHALVRDLGDQRVSENRLWNARKLGVAFKAGEIRRLLRASQKSNFTLTPSHALALATVVDEEKRVELADRCINERQSVKQLRREIHRLQGKKSKGGKPLAETRSVDDALQDVLEQSRDWQNRCRERWFSGPASPLVRPLSIATAKRLEEPLLEAEKALKELEDAAAEARRRLRAQRLRARAT